MARLLKVLLQIDATMRYDFARRGLRPTAEMLAGRGQINISRARPTARPRPVSLPCTTLGPIDPLCELDAGQGYDELLAHSESFVDEGRQLRVLDLPTLIRVKTKAGRSKDRVMLPVLIATLQEREKLGK